MRCLASKLALGTRVVDLAGVLLGEVVWCRVGDDGRPEVGVVVDDSVSEDVRLWPWELFKAFANGRWGVCILSPEFDPREVRGGGELQAWRGRESWRRLLQRLRDQEVVEL